MQVGEATVTRILLVEDEAIFARDLAERLEGLGYPVLGTASSGEEALQLASLTRPSLVLMDIRIQGAMDGIETAKRLSALMDVPIIFLTAQMDTGTIQKAKLARPYGYLIKPLEERELITTIEMAMGRHQKDVSARLIELAVANAGLAIAMVSARGPGFPIVMCNPSFEGLTGYAARDAWGKSPWFLEGEGTDQLRSAQLRRAMEEGRDWRTTLTCHRLDGSAFKAEIVLSAVRNAAGETTHLLMCYTDLSSRQRTGETARPPQTY